MTYDVKFQARCTITNEIAVDFSVVTREDVDCIKNDWLTDNVGCNVPHIQVRRC